MKIRHIAATILAGTIATASLVACSSESADTATENTSSNTPHIKIGSTDASSKGWETFEKKAKDNGIDLEVVSFTDYTTPNRALSGGNIDVNQFQHLKFLAEYNVGTGEHLVPVGSSFIVPLSLYWKEHDSLDGIEGSDIAIPNDSTNQGRAINVLVQAKLVTLKEAGIVTPTPADIDPSKSKVSVVPVEATQTATAWAEGRPAIINNNFLERAGIDPASAIFRDDPSSPEAEPYINVFAVNEDRVNDENIKKLVELWHSDEVQEAIGEDTKNTAFEVKVPADKLQEILARLESQVQ